MNIKDIRVGRVYELAYKDPNYPCHCPCHNNALIKHCMPCCYDRSYYGYSTCFYIFLDKKQAIFVTHQNTYRFLKLLIEESVISEAKLETPLLLNAQQIQFLMCLIGES